MAPANIPPPLASPRRKGKEIPRLPLSAFSPPNTGTSDAFAIPPTPSLITPTGIVDSQLQVNVDSAGVYKADASHLNLSERKAVVLTVRGQSAEAIISSKEALRSSVLDVRVLSVLIPFSLDNNEVPGYLSVSDTFPAALTTTYNGAIPVAAEAEEENKDQTQLETPVKNLGLALKNSKVVDINVEGDIMSTDSSFYDSFVNLLTKATRAATPSAEGRKRAAIVLTNLLPPPLGSTMPVVTMMNHPTYTTYRQRVSLLSLFENVHVKLLPPPWLTVESTTGIESERREREWRNLIKLFIVPVLEAFGFERIIFGSGPASDTSALPASWYKLVLESFRELAVGQDEMDKIFMENAEGVYAA